VNRLSSRGWGEETAGGKRTEERGGERGREREGWGVKRSQFLLSPSSCDQTLPAATRPFQPEPVHKIAWERKRG